MKILYLVHQFYPEYYTGTEKFVYTLADMMQKIGNKVKVITYSFYEESFYDRMIGNILLKEFVYKGVPVIALRHRNIPEDVHLALKNDELYKIAIEVIIDEKPDIIHAGHLMRVTEFINAARILNIPYIITITDSFLICPKIILQASIGNLCAGPRGGNVCLVLCPEIPSPFILQRLNITNNILTNAALVVSPSIFLASIFKKEHKNIDVKTINHGISYSKIKRNQNVYDHRSNLKFCYAGSLNSHKGVHVLLDAFMRVESDNASLRIYGSGTDEIYVKTLKDMAKGDKRIEFCGIFSEEQVGDIFSQIDVVVVPSICYETYSLVMHESLACNVPVIVSNVGGTAEKVTNGLNGYTFRIGDSNHLKEVIEQVVNDPDKINQLKTNLKNSMIQAVEQEAYAYEKEYTKIYINR
jgi:glycosyltransferase involved in cell wall biosynthesis